MKKKKEGKGIMRAFVIYGLFPFLLSAIIEMVFWALIYRRLTIAHEVGHAKVAVSKGLDTFILFPFRVKENMTDIMVYCVKKKDFRIIYKKGRAGAVTIYRETEILTDEDRLSITRGGPTAAKKYLLRKSIQFPLYFVTVTIGIFVINLINQYLGDNIKIYILLLDVAVISVIGQMSFMSILLKAMKGINAKQQIKKYEKCLSNCKQNSSYALFLSDNAKIKYWNKYLHCEQIKKDKNLRSENEYDEIINRLNKLQYIKK